MQNLEKNTQLEIINLSSLEPRNKELASKIIDFFSLKPTTPIVLVGGCLADIVAKIDKIPLKGMDANAQIIDEQIGGCALNVARVLYKFKAPMINAMPIGKGKRAERIKAEFAKLDLDVNIQIDAKDNGYCLALVTPDKERTFITFNGAETIYRIEDLEKIQVPSNAIIYLNGYELVLDSDLLTWIQNMSGEQKFIVDFGPMIVKIQPSIFESLLEKKNIIFSLNEEETKILLGNLYEDCIRNYAVEKNVDLLIRLGAKGAIVAEKSGKISYIAPFSTQVIDTIGAGDCHTGAVIAGLSAGLNLPSSTLLGNISGAYTVSHIGAEDTCTLSFYQEKLNDLIGSNN